MRAHKVLKPLNHFTSCVVTYLPYEIAAVLHEDTTLLFSDVPKFMIAFVEDHNRSRGFHDSKKDGVVYRLPQQVAGYACAAVP